MLEPGKFYIGDPCYVIADNLWESFAAQHAMGDSPEFFFNANEKVARVWAHQAFATGEFEGSNRRNFYCDSGVLAAIPVELCDSFKLESLLNEGGESGHMATILERGCAWSPLVQGYTFRFGYILIHTKGHSDASPWSILHR